VHVIQNWPPHPHDDPDGDGILSERDDCPNVADPAQLDRDAKPFSCADAADCLAQTGCALDDPGTGKLWLFCVPPKTFADAEEVLSRPRHAPRAAHERRREREARRARRRVVAWARRPRDRGDVRDGRGGRSDVHAVEPGRTERLRRQRRLRTADRRWRLERLELRERAALHLRGRGDAHAGRLRRRVRQLPARLELRIRRTRTATASATRARLSP